MSYIKYIFVTFSFLSLLFALNAQTCNDLPVDFKSYTEALSKVKAATFLIKERIDCSESSWIKSAEYYSCDGYAGFFILTTKEDKFFLHKNVPIHIWKGFKGACSFGSYYNRNIKGKYKFLVDNSG